ncbi:NADPH-dependent FMN reductase [bacterium (Candidatus Blackallbacteria) CG17_big_fil_post_rev_8_21_14_2_50_48_46]|uniref:NADPH-dependent FMN reductase n=1 Tax=bacterium (Candidatus Blackallbacteria) CG17_big_fil_post_rev_8_21_14_2_50_48_46 TaxID=2014261 RepID=A0A2M7GAM2_9BACT|nr:MAG: NADPH-dependent FMN reductase [bacterium (Candidatus Blackallbacteria) CG18_big_fil_WC_8_21_14_2_50_49_26]PIW19201.1 MAG: NADPH-dependent FMN reductase [bacterium (Candidatus Blackallbacteria) CG17_big_fil_post_rev_8_21_14_2_50_48_46]PIW45449.1 MAG: NADPH-dependent FMN reductase [bacterium (Candidatus Blackallbacteria) CG13_big_fil_rev_8_21_14_2_50_49_14]
MKKILALAGSNSQSSIHRQLLEIAAKNIHADVTIQDLSRFDNIPIYNPDRQKAQGFPPEIEAFFQELQSYDGILLASPEYNGSIPAALKNLIDWLSRIQMRFFSEKPLLLMSTSPGPNGGKTNLTQMATLVPWWGAQLVGTYSLGRYFEVLDPENMRLNGLEESRLSQALEKFMQALESTSIEKVA